MRRIIVIFNILFLCTSLSAQTDEEIDTLIKKGVYAEQEGDLKNAITYFEQSKEGLEKLNQTNEDIYVIVSYKLACCYRSIGDYVKVKKYIGIGSKVLDVIKEDDPTYVVFSHNLADCYYAINKYSRAIDINNKALEVCKKIKGENHPDYLRVLRNTAHYYYKNGEYSNAIK